MDNSHNGGSEQWGCPRISLGASVVQCVHNDWELGLSCEVAIFLDSTTLFRMEKTQADFLEHLKELSMMAQWAKK